MMRTLLLLLSILLGDSLNAEERLLVGGFSSGSMASWDVQEIKDVKKATDYHMVEELPGQWVLKAISKDTASALLKKQHIDLEKTPYMNWRWKITNYLSNIHEQRKSGDDYAARIYVIPDPGVLFWQSSSVHYVWASNTPKMEVWPNAVGGESVKMIALRSRDDQLQTWYTEKRNVREDLKTLLGKDIRYLDAVGLMTDTDNSRETAWAFYGDIYFTEQ